MLSAFVVCHKVFRLPSTLTVMSCNCGVTVVSLVARVWRTNKLSTCLIITIYSYCPLPLMQALAQSCRHPRMFRQSRMYWQGWWHSTRYYCPPQCRHDRSRWRDFHHPYHSNHLTGEVMYLVSRNRSISQLLPMLHSWC